MLKKLKDTLLSTNALVGMIAILVSGALVAAGGDGAAGQAIVDSVGEAIRQKDYLLAFTLLMSQFIQPLRKGMENGFDWLRIKKSKNFWTNVISFVLVIIQTILNVAFPESAAHDFVDAFFQGEWDLVVVAFITQITNFVYHLFLDDTPLGEKVRKYLQPVLTIFQTK